MAAIATRGDYDFGDELPKTGGSKIPSGYSLEGVYTSDLPKTDLEAMEVYSKSISEGDMLLLVAEGMVIASASVSTRHAFSRKFDGVYVSGIKVDSKYRNRSIGLTMYFILMNLYGAVFGDLSQSDGARRVWRALSKFGNVSILDTATGKVLKKNYKITDTLDPNIWVLEDRAEDLFISEKESYTAMNVCLGFLGLNAEGKKVVKKVK